MSRLKLLYYENLGFQETVLEYMREFFEVVSLPSPEEDSAEILAEVDIAMAPLGYDFGPEKIDRCLNLKIIASSTLSVPHIDTVYAECKGIAVCYLSEREKEFLNTITPTAELTWGLMIALTRKIPWAHDDVCAGKWDGRFWGRKAPRMLSDMSLGIIGLGRLGSLVASYGKAFGMDVYYYSPRSRKDEYIHCPTLADLAEKSDIVSVHCHQLPETENIIGHDFMGAMKSGSYLINTARGALVNEEALLESLLSNHLAGAALDVLAAEYLPDFSSNLKQTPLVAYAREHDNLIITPHYGGATLDAWKATQKRTINLVVEMIKTEFT